MVYHSRGRATLVLRASSRSRSQQCCGLVDEDSTFNLEAGSHPKQRPCGAIRQLDVQLRVEEILEQRWAGCFEVHVGILSQGGTGCNGRQLLPGHGLHKTGNMPLPLTAKRVGPMVSVV